MYTVLHEEKHTPPVQATTSSSVRSGKHIFCSNEVWLKLVALWAAVKLYVELAFADITSRLRQKLDKDVNGHCSYESYSCILSRTVDIWIGETPLSLLNCFTPPPAAVLFSCSEPLLWTACPETARDGLWGDPLFTCHLLQHKAENLRKPASLAVQQEDNPQNLAKWLHGM